MLNSAQQKALSLASAGHNIFINGPAGTGKTFTIHEIKKHLEQCGKNVQITCTTGIACANFKDHAITLHRWSGIHDGRFSSSEVINTVRANQEALSRIRSTDVLIIDEISMLSKKLFNQVIDILENIRVDKTFLGGIQLIVSGDFLQLPPVPNKSYSDSGEYCFVSSSFQKLHKVTLTEVVRQQEPDLINAIKQVSLGGHIDDDVVNYIHGLNRPLSEDVDSTKLFATNHLVQSYNRLHIERQEGDIHEYLSNDSGDKKYLNELTTPPKLWLKKGCPVVLTRNLSDRLYNGLRGTVTDFQPDGLLVYFPSLKTTSTIGKVTFSVFSPTENKLLASREQVPLVSAYAITIHKAQGMTLDSVEIDCQQIFKAGQLGVAIARARNSAGLRVINFTPKVCLPQPKEILTFLEEPPTKPEDDMSCCRTFKRNTGESDEGFWFDGEIECDVPITEDDLEDDFNDVIATINTDLNNNQEELPGEFKLENVLESCQTENPMTDIQTEVNEISRNMKSNSIDLCKRFCSTQFKEISTVMKALDVTPGSKISAPKLTDIYAEIHKYMTSTNYRISCLLLFQNYPNFTGAHSFICTTLTNNIRKFLIGEKARLYTEMESQMKTREITDASKPRIRYVAGYCVSSLRKQYTVRCKTNMYSSSASGQQSYFEAKDKLTVLNALTEDENFLKLHSNDKESLVDIDRRQFMTRGLLNVSDEMYTFAMDVCRKSLALLVDKNINVHGKSVHLLCQEKLLHDKQLFEKFLFCVKHNMTREEFQSTIGVSVETDVREVLTSTLDKVHSVNVVFNDLVSKFLMVMMNQFRKDLLHTFAVSRTMAHRKQILIKQQKKETSTKTVSFKSILEDKTKNREMSHSLLRGLLMSNVNVLDQMKKFEIEKIGKAYGVTGKQNTKKGSLIEIVRKCIMDSTGMPNANFLDSLSSSSDPQTAKASTSKETTQRTAVHEEPQPTSTGVTATESTAQVVLGDDSSSDSTSDEELCGHCQKIGREGVQWIQCSSCSTWYHRNCAGLRLKRDWEKYQEESVEFLCKLCI